MPDTQNPPPKINEAVRIPIDQLIPFELNPNVMTEQQLGKLVREIRENGFDEPLQVIKRNEQYVVIGGNHRWKAAKLLEFKDLPCVVYAWNDRQAMEECVSRNLLKGDLDHTKFGSLLASYMKGEKDFDWAKIAEAFSVQEADLFKALKSSDDLQEFAKSLRPVDATPKAKPKQVPIPLRGDIWQLGNHRIICGDAANPDDIAKLMGDERARLIMVDPANAVDYEKAIQAKKGEQSAPDGGKQDDYTDLLTQILGNCLQFVLPRTAWYVWNADRKNVLDALQAVGILMHQQIVWIKPAALATRSFFSKQHESAFYGVKNGDKPVLNAEQVLAYVDHHDTGIFGWKKGDSKPLHHLGADRHLTSVWYADFDGKSGNGGSLPPTTKPVSLFHIPMLHHTDSGAVCLDPFAGSGTQIMAGESIGRRVFACEISPIFVEVAIRRWQNYMQLPAECLTREVAPPPIDKPNAQDK